MTNNKPTNQSTPKHIQLYMVKVSRALLMVKIRCNIPSKPTTIELTTKCSIGFQLHDRFHLGVQHSFQLEERFYRSENTVTSVDEMYNVTLYFAKIMFTDVGEYNSLGRHIYIQDVLIGLRIKFDRMF